MLTLAELLERPSYPTLGAMRLNDVCPAFIKAVVAAAQAVWPGKVMNTNAINTDRPAK